MNKISYTRINDCKPPRPSFEDAVNMIRVIKARATRREFDMGTGHKANREENSLIILFCDYLEQQFMEVSK